MIGGRANTHSPGEQSDGPAAEVNDRLGDVIVRGPGFHSGGQRAREGLGDRPDHSRRRYLNVVTLFEVLFWVFYIGAYAAMYGLITKNFPTRIRGTGTGFVTAGVWIGNAVTGLIAPPLVSTAGVADAFVFGGMVPGLIAAFLFLLARSTRPGAELEQIAR